MTDLATEKAKFDEHVRSCDDCLLAKHGQGRTCRQSQSMRQRIAKMEAAEKSGSMRTAPVKAESTVDTKLVAALTVATFKASEMKGAEVKVTVDTDYEYERAIKRTWDMLEGLGILDVGKTNIAVADESWKSGKPVSLELTNGSCVTLILSDKSKAVAS
jgi:hypothetical protein